MSLPTPYYDHAGITIYHADCREILPYLPKVDLVLTDPPYGIAWNGYGKSGKSYDAIVNDESEMDLGFLLNMDCRVITFGGNCYLKQLPHRGRWIVWDKRVDPRADKAFGSPFEMAWVNVTSGHDKIFRIQHGGFVNADGGASDRVHPTQKPVSLMFQILQHYPAELTLDPFMGSGTTLVAAKQLGRKAIGIEIEEKYCQIAVERLSQEVLFTPEPEPDVRQGSLI